MMPIPTLARLLEEARTVGPLPVVVAGAENDTALTAVAHARRKRIAEVVLVGGAAGIRGGSPRSARIPPATGSWRP